MYIYVSAGCGPRSSTNAEYLAPGIARATYSDGVGPGEKFPGA